MFDSVNRSKFRIPAKQKGFLHRARLIDWMHENSHRKLTFVSAPAGYGKTSLLLDFARDVEARVCWFLVTREDKDLRRFAWDFLLSIRKTFPAFGSEIETFLKTTQGDIDSVNLAVDFVNEALKTIDDYTLLFIDDYHIVTESDDVTSFIELFLDYLPDGVRVVLASRSAFGIPAGKLYARDQLRTLNVEQLRFRPDELQKFVARVYRLNLSDNEARELAKRTDGWIVAAMLAARSLNRGSIPEFEGSAEHVYSFLAQDVIEREAEELQDFMLATSVVDEFNVGLANYLTSSQDAEEQIQELEKRNLFILRIETGSGTAYRFHQLFLEFLRYRLAAGRRGWEQELHRRAADWYREDGDWDHAIQHYLSVDDRLAAARLMDLVAKQYFVAGENRTVQNWLEILRGPPDVREASPELVLNRAKYLVDQKRLPEADQLLGIAEHVFESTGETDKILNALSVRGMIHLLENRFSEAKGVVRQARRILKGEIQGVLYIARSQQFDRIEGLSYLWQGKTIEGVRRLEKVADSLKKMIGEIDSRQTRIQCAHDLVLSLDAMGLALHVDGQIYPSLKYLLDALDYREKYLPTNQGLIYSLNNIGFIFFQIGDYLESYRYLQRALKEAETLEKGQAYIHLQNSWSDLLREVDAWDEAELRLRAALKVGKNAQQKKKELDNSGSYLAYMRLERARGNYDRAIYYLHESYRLKGISPDTPEFKSHLGSIYFSMGQNDLAIETFSEAVNAFQAAGSSSESYATAAYLLGAAFSKNGNPDEAVIWLDAAFNTAARLGYEQFLVSEGRRTKEILTEAAGKLPEFGQLRLILKRVDEFQPGIAQFEREIVPQQPVLEKFHLEILGFGSAKVRLNGEVIEKSDWRASMPKALFYYLLDRGGDTGANIKLAFWPDKPASKATSNFQSTLWRARKALKKANILVLESETYRISDAIDLWYDVRVFENLLAGARDRAHSESERVALLRSAVELYSGPFLEGNFMDWADERRIELQRRYEAALEQIGRYDYERGQYTEAASVFEKLIQCDPYRDDIQILVMECLIKNGAAHSANRRYRSYTRFLEVEGLEPSSELVSFYKTLSQHL